MKEEIIKLKSDFLNDIRAVNTLDDLNNIRINYLGKKSKIQEYSISMRDMNADEKKELGKLINEFKNEANEALDNLKVSIENIELNKKLESENIDVTLDA